MARETGLSRQIKNGPYLIEQILLFDNGESRGYCEDAIF
jgi:hypothetical protein